MMNKCGRSFNASVQEYNTQIPIIWRKNCSRVLRKNKSINQTFNKATEGKALLSPRQPLNPVLIRWLNRRNLALKHETISENFYEANR